MSFLKAEYRVLAIYVPTRFCFWIPVYQVETTHWFIVVAFVIGAIGLRGRRIYRHADRDQANVRTTMLPGPVCPRRCRFPSVAVTVMGLERSRIGCLWPGCTLCIFSFPG